MGNGCGWDGHCGGAISVRWMCTASRNLCRRYLGQSGDLWGCIGSSFVVAIVQALTCLVGVSVNYVTSI